MVLLSLVIAYLDNMHVMGYISSGNIAVFAIS